MIVRILYGLWAHLFLTTRPSIFPPQFVQWLLVSFFFLLYCTVKITLKKYSGEIPSVLFVRAFVQFVQTNLCITLSKRFFTMKGTYISHFLKGYYCEEISHWNEGPPLIGLRRELKKKRVLLMLLLTPKPSNCSDLIISLHKPN